jgi:hypothetical protein
MTIKHDYFKGLKRAFSIYLKEKSKNKNKIKRLTAFFNSDAGLLYKCRSDLGVIALMLEQTFRPVAAKDVEHSVQRVVEQLEKVPEGAECVRKVMKTRRGTTEKLVSLLQVEVHEVLNDMALQYIENNTDLLLY